MTACSVVVELCGAVTMFVCPTIFVCAVGWWVHDTREH
jgi:hypothetical protein